MPGVRQLVWWGTFGVGCYGAINALSAGRTDIALFWLSWIGFWAYLEFEPR